MADPIPNPTQCDEGIRKGLAISVILQFVAVVGWMVWTGRKLDDTQMILGAEIGFVSIVLNYYFGSSSGSKAKDAAKETQP